jgi:signal transduction histidine kinase
MSILEVVDHRTPDHRTIDCPKISTKVNDREVDRRSAVGSPAMSLIHDLRNPLAAIHSGAEILNASPLPEQQIRRLARNMYSASVRINELLQDYIEQFRDGAGQPRPSSLRGLVARSVERIAAVAEAQSVLVGLDVPADLVVAANRARIDSVLANLLANALEAMPSGGSIHVSALARAGSVVVRVRDTGPGVEPGIRSRLFQPFVTARKSNGWGLGLASARQAVLDHGGDMWLESPPGGGACFGFCLPAWPENCHL